MLGPPPTGLNDARRSGCYRDFTTRALPRSGFVLRPIPANCRASAFFEPPPKIGTAAIHPTQTFTDAGYRDRIWPNAERPLRRRSAGKTDGLLRPNAVVHTRPGCSRKQTYPGPLPWR